MKVYVVVRNMIGNTCGGAIDDVVDDCGYDLEVFNTLEDAKNYLNDSYEQDVFDFLDDLVDGYYEDEKEDTQYHVSVWDDCGEGTDIQCQIIEKEV